MPSLNTFQLNTGLLNGASTLDTVYSTDLVVFDGFSLADNSSMITQQLLDSGPNRVLIGEDIPREDGKFLLADYWRERIIEVRGYAKKSTKEDTGRLSRHNPQETRWAVQEPRHHPFEHGRDDDYVRRFVATLQNPEQLFAARQGYHITICPFLARFVCRTPFATNRMLTSR